MKKSLPLQVLTTIRRHRMFRAGDRVGVAVSGGADSVALLRLLEELGAGLGIRLLVVHFNHRLRGKAADADQRFVAALASSRGLEFIAESQDVAAAARKHNWNLEEAGRRLRYDFFSRLLDSGRAERIATGHTADDQAETVLAHLLRGTGPTGLAGIYPVMGRVVRPLLAVRRAALRDYLTSAGQKWREDPTNLDRARMRARIRSVLLPLLERDFQPAAVERLAELAALARDDEAFWSALVEDRFRVLVRESDAGWEIFTRDLLAPLPLTAPPEASAEPAARLSALSRRLVRRLYAAVRGDRRQLSAQHVAAVLHLAAETGRGRRIELPAGVEVEKSFDRLLFLQRAKSGRRGARGREAPPAYEYALTVPRRGETSVAVPEIGARFTLKVIDWPGTARDTRSSREALDRERLRPPVVLRSWRPGDAYRPRGRRSVRKLKRLFLDHRIPARQRAGWPVLACEGRPAWARGLPAAEEFSAGGETRRAVVILEEPL
jgi:tRNA(Ile)-lysidine synthase